MTDNELLVWLKLRMRGEDNWGPAPEDFDTLQKQFSQDWPNEEPTKGRVKVLLRHALEIARGLN